MDGAPTMTLGRRVRWARRWCLAHLGRAFLFSFSRLPRPVALGVGRMGGALWHSLGRQSRRRAQRHLELAFGDRYTDAERRRLVKRMFRHFAETAADALVMYRLGPEGVRAKIPIVGWEEAIAVAEAALEEGNGIVGITGHLGNWELLACLASQQWPDQTVHVGRRYRYDGYNDLVDRFRTRLGVQMVYQDESPRGLVRMLRSNKMVGILPDQDVKRVHGIFVDYFGRPAYTPSAPANLCHRIGSPIAQLYAVREGKGYRVLVSPLLRREDVADSADPVAELTRRWTERLEECVERYTEQWVWFHRRWRTTPEILARRRARAAALESSAERS